MATATPPPPVTSEKRADWQRKVSDPLERLRGYIRLYISIEGAAVLLLYLALWFWIGLLLDYGFFKLFTLDWVQVLPWGFRAGLLVLLVSGLLALLVAKVTLRLMREFRDSALALVLERRFPKLLGDRLITAVELADPQKAAQYGYSQAMIDQTVQDAAERVDQVPVNEAFNWKRLRNTVLMVTGLTLGLFVLSAAGYFAVQAVASSEDEDGKSGASAGSFFTDFGNVSAIWFERNILLQNTIWPRRVYLELVNFPEDPNNPDKPLTVGKNVGSAPIRVRALKWVIADKNSPEGWRQLMWSDLNDKLLGFTAPPLPAQFFKGNQDWSVDYVDAQTDRDDVRQKMNQTLPTINGNLRDVIGRLKELTDQSAMSRTLRKLEIPDEVVVEYKGATTQSEQTLKREDNNEYAGVLTDLKETVRFRACAVDYCTRPRTIAVVPPPTLHSLEREEFQPAYLYHRVPRGGSTTDIKDKKQHLPRESVYLGGDTSRIDLPSGTDLKLIGSTGTGETDKDLEKVLIQPRGLPEFQKTLVADDLKKKPPEEAWADVKKVGKVKLLDNRTFEVEIRDITSRIDFDFELTDTDKVVSRRHIVIQPADDVAPDVEAGPSTIIRKTAEGYMVTPVAKIPFEGRVRDDHGLNRLVYDYAYVAFDEHVDAQVRGVLAMRLFLPTPNAVGGALFAAPLTASVVKTINESMKERKGEVPLDTFEVLLTAKARRDVPRDMLLQRLRDKPPEDQLIKNHDLNPKDEGFDLQRHLPELKASGAVQPRYRLKLRLTATDTNIQTGRDLEGRPSEGSVSASKETFSFIIVSEDELLAAIAREEGELYDKLKVQGLTKLEILRTRLGAVDGYLRAADFNAKDYGAHAERSLQIAEGINAVALTAREVHGEYVRILNEMQVNRVEKHVGQVTKVIAPLEQALNNEFPAAEEAQRELHRALETAEKDPEAAKRVPELLTNAQRRLHELIIKVEQAIDAMGQLKLLNDQIKLAREVLQLQLDNLIRLRILQRLKELELFGD